MRPGRRSCPAAPKRIKVDDMRGLVRRTGCGRWGAAVLLPVVLLTALPARAEDGGFFGFLSHALGGGSSAAESVCIEGEAMKSTMRGLSAALLFGMIGVGCESMNQQGVKSDLHSQWVDVYADVETTTNAAKQVFTDDKLTDVSAQSTMVDGEASGVTADKTKIYASVKKADKGSQVSIQVGTLGSPKMGAEYAAKIKQIAEKKPM